MKMKTILIGLAVGILAASCRRPERTGFIHNLRGIDPTNTVTHEIDYNHDGTSDVRMVYGPPPEGNGIFVRLQYGWSKALPWVPSLTLPTDSKGRPTTQFSATFFAQTFPGQRVPKDLRPKPPFYVFDGTAWRQTE